MSDDKNLFIRNCLMTILSVNNIYGDGKIVGVVEKSNAGVSFFLEIKSSEMNTEEIAVIQDFFQNNFWFMFVMDREFYSFLSEGENVYEEVNFRDVEKKVVNLEKVKLMPGEDNFKNIYIKFNEFNHFNYRIFGNEHIAFNCTPFNELASDAYGYAVLNDYSFYETSYIYISFDSIRNEVSFLLNKNKLKRDFVIENVMDFLEGNLKKIYLANNFYSGSTSY